MEIGDLTPILSEVRTFFLFSHWILDTLGFMHIPVLQQHGTLYAAAAAAAVLRTAVVRTVVYAFEGSLFFKEWKYEQPVFALSQKLATTI